MKVVSPGEVVWYTSSSASGTDQAPADMVRLEVWSGVAGPGQLDGALDRVGCCGQQCHGRQGEAEWTGAVAGPPLPGRLHGNAIEVGRLRCRGRVGKNGIALSWGARQEVEIGLDGVAPLDAIGDEAAAAKATPADVHRRFSGIDIRREEGHGLGGIALDRPLRGRNDEAAGIDHRDPVYIGGIGRQQGVHEGSLAHFKNFGQGIHLGTLGDIAQYPIGDKGLLTLIGGPNEGRCTGRVVQGHL